MKKKSILLASILLAISVLLSLFVLYTPIPSSDSSGFSAVSAAGFIKDFSLAPHSIYDEEAHEEVRMYLKDTLSEFIGEDQVFEYDYTAAEAGTDYDVHDLFGIIPGQSDIAVMLVAHYDSRGHIGRSGELGGSYGAADDGYGLAVILEIARLFGGRDDLQNSIYVLFTDAEEVGLDGARMFAQESDIMANVGFVINLEARGIQGAAYMFETSANNETIIDFYHNADLPVSYSIATAVYRVMPNLTDFTEFLDIDKQGVNFAVLDSLYYYHTPRDNYTNINLSSIQHYGAQVLPLVEEFTSDSVYSDVNYFVGAQDQVFFTLFPNVFVSYTDAFARIFQLLLFAIEIALLVYLILKKEIRGVSVIKNTGWIFLSIVVFGVVYLYLSKLIAWIGKTPWNLTYVRMEGSELPTLILMIVGVVGYDLLYRKLVKSETERKAFIIAAILINIVLANLTGWTLSGASFLFLIPSLMGLLVLILETFVKKPLVYWISSSVAILIMLLVLIPLLYSLFMALTVGGLAALVAIMIFYLILLVPLFEKQLHS